MYNYKIYYIIISITVWCVLTIVKKYSNKNNTFFHITKNIYEMYVWCNVHENNAK